MKDIQGTTRVCGLIGHPVEHTKSPLIHNSLAEATGIDLAYVPFCVESGRLGEAVSGAYALNLLGLNVTVPYKSDVIPHLVEIDPLAEQIGAVNTLVRTEGGFQGYNTDMPGLYRAMCSDGVQVENSRVLLLGAGGVARAVAMLLARKGAASVTILNRTVSRGEAIAREVNGFLGRELVTALPLEGYRLLEGERAYLAIQATNVGMYPHTEETLIEDAAFYRLVHTGYDLIFNPARTRFMELVEASGAKACNGLKMLLYQGVIAYELWTEQKVPEALCEDVYGRLLLDVGGDAAGSR